MALEIKGLDVLEKKLKDLEVSTNSVTKKAIDKALNETLPILQHEAPKDSGDGAKALEIKDSGAKKYRRSAWGKMGITSENWNETKHLLFQHYGFYNVRAKKNVAKHIGWFDEASDKILPKAER